MNYGDCLKQQRLASGKSLLEVAKDTGISHQNLSRWERNEVMPTLDFCIKLAAQIHGKLGTEQYTPPVL